MASGRARERAARGRHVRLIREDGSALPLHVRRCDTFLCRLRGLTFRRSLGDGEGLLFLEPTESRLGTAIHMLFVFFPIGVAWMDGTGKVVDLTVARPFRPFYAPQAPARSFLEGPPSLVDWLRVGERLQVVPETVAAAKDAGDGGAA
ncbi:MAG: DUF192 domain-containing protein [Anaerolineae bacterium]